MINLAQPVQVQCQELQLQFWACLWQPDFQSHQINGRSKLPMATCAKVALGRGFNLLQTGVKANSHKSLTHDSLLKSQLDRLP